MAKSLKWVIPISFILFVVCFTIDEINEQYWNVGWMYPIFRSVGILGFGIFALSIAFALVLYGKNDNS